jgi:hypothetical protein
MLLKQYAVEKGYRTIFDLLHNAPIESIQQLLPDYNYLTNGTSLSGVHPPYPTNYPRNTLLEDLAASQSTLTSRADITNMVGDTHNNDTIAGLRIASSTTPRLWPDGMPEGFNNLLGDHGLNLGAGDGTVPLSSATSVGGSSITFNSDHQHLVTDAATTTYKILTGREVAASTSFRALLTHFLMVRVFSPVDMQVVAPDGMRIGKDFVTGTTLNEIPDAFYTGFQGVEGEFVVIPEPASGQYKVITQGTGTGGSYTVATDYLADATTSEQTFTGTTPANLLIEHTMNLDTIHPTNDTLVPVDTTPPSITKDQPATSTYTHADQLPIHVTFTDNTGVATSSVVFDGQSVNASSTVDLFYTTLGIHALVLSAQDFVHNATTSTTTITIIATIPSTISDVNRAYSLGWITNLAYKRSLLTTLALAGNISAQMGELEQRPLPSKVIKEGAVFNKILLKIILLALQLGKSQKYLTAQGYTVLVNDINWLLAH